MLAGIAYYRRREPRGLVTHLLALAQTLIVAQVGLGLLLLSEHYRSPHRLHYLYGSLASPRCSRRGSTRRPTGARGLPGSRGLPLWQARSPCGRT